MKKIFKFLKSAKAELDKVKWPTKKQVMKLTKTVILASLAVAVFLGMLDFIFNHLVTKVL
ncbi:MAG: preprotein translocase subunit SecE [Patescibacteria group bacterium]|nr:preprotein translocase subunit SecE [Patescibacteria group bacterium]